ncbi:MAG: hypothetical protein U0Y82_02730 [Thermoleophilia bacterium]
MCGITVRPEPADSWPDDKLVTAYRVFSACVERVLGLPPDDAGRERLAHYRGMCEDIGVVMVQRGLM